MLLLNINEQQRRHLKTMLETLQALQNVQFGIFDFSPEGNVNGLLIQAFNNLDLLAELKLSEAWFDGYQCSANHVIQIDINLMVRMLKVYGYNDLVSIRILDQHQQNRQETTMDFIYLNAVDNVWSTFELAVFPVNPPPANAYPNMYDATIIMPSTCFARISKNLIRIQDRATISVLEEQGVDVLRLLAQQAPLMWATTMCSHTPNRIFIFRQVDVEAVVLLRNMKIFSKAVRVSPSVYMRLINNERHRHVLLEHQLPHDSFFRFYLGIIN